MTAWTWVDEWAVWCDPAVPAEARRRALARVVARSRGQAAETPPEDEPYLVRHREYACCHGELVRDYGDGWQHVSDHVPCPPDGVEVAVP